MRFIRIILFFAVAIIPLAAEGAVAKWAVVPADSHITFTATQNHAPVQGSFKQFDATIYFDEQKLAESSVDVSIAMNSVDAAYEDVVLSLQDTPWFDVKNFPKAEFKTKGFRHLEGNHYEADAILTIRSVSLPITFPFTLDIKEDDGNYFAKVYGQTTLKRTAFGVGQGEWKDTKTVEDDVTVEITLSALKLD